MRAPAHAILPPDLRDVLRQVGLEHAAVIEAAAVEASASLEAKMQQVLESRPSLTVTDPDWP